MQVQKKVTATGAEQVVELGFVPSKLVIINRSSLAEIVWTSELPIANYYKQVAAGTRTLVTSGGPLVVDGSDKTANLNKSFGFKLPAIADINDTNGEILDVEAIRDDI